MTRCLYRSLHPRGKMPLPSRRCGISQVACWNSLRGLLGFLCNVEIHVSLGNCIWVNPLNCRLIGRDWWRVRLKAEGEEGDRGWDGWLASPIQWTRTWANSGRQWGMERPGVLQSMGSQKAGHDWMTERQQQWKLSGEILREQTSEWSICLTFWRRRLLSSWVFVATLFEEAELAKCDSHYHHILKHKTPRPSVEKPNRKLAKCSPVHWPIPTYTVESRA